VHALDGFNAYVRELADALAEPGASDSVDARDQKLDKRAEDTALRKSSDATAVRKRGRSA
jgi:hypothetical protein